MREIYLGASSDLEFGSRGVGGEISGRGWDHIAFYALGEEARFRVRSVKQNPG